MNIIFATALLVINFAITGMDIVPVGIKSNEENIYGGYKELFEKVFVGSRIEDLYDNGKFKKLAMNELQFQQLNTIECSFHLIKYVKDKYCENVSDETTCDILKDCFPMMKKIGENQRAFIRAIQKEDFVEIENLVKNDTINLHWQYNYMRYGISRSGTAFDIAVFNQSEKMLEYLMEKGVKFVNPINCLFYDGSLLALQFLIKNKLITINNDAFEEAYKALFHQMQYFPFTQEKHSLKMQLLLDNLIIEEKTKNILLQASRELKKIQTTRHKEWSTLKDIEDANNKILQLLTNKINRIVEENILQVQ